jgi:hypothetical protein
MKTPIRMVVLGVTLVLAFAAAKSARANIGTCVPVHCGTCCTNHGVTTCMYFPCLPPAGVP